MIQDIVGYEIFTGVLTYRDNLSVAWKTMLSVILFLFLFETVSSSWELIFATFSQYFWMYLSTYWITEVLIFLVVSALRLAVLPFRVHLCG